MPSLVTDFFRANFLKSNLVPNNFLQMFSEEENLLGPTRAGGLGLVTAIIFLSGEMAGSGVLALPKALVGTGGF